MTYHWSVRLLHWAMALMIFSLFGVGMWMTGLPREEALRGEMTALHKAFGVMVLGFLILRVTARLATPKPPLPAAIPARERMLAQWSYPLVYALMAAVPLAGIAMSQSYGFKVMVFGWEFPTLFTPDKMRADAAREWHETLAIALMVAVGVHAAAVVKHWRVEKINLLPRIWR